MLTMYEKLMTLPIFKGVGEDVISKSIEKTPLVFKNYHKGEFLISKGVMCDGLICLLSGEILVKMTLAQGNVLLTARYGTGKVIGLDHLYGLNNQYDYDIVASEECSVIEFSKDQYYKMINSNYLCHINFLNILSYKSQKVEWSMKTYLNKHVIGKLATIVSIFTDRDVKEVMLSGFNSLAALQTDDVISDYDFQIRILIDNKLALEDEMGNIIIPSRNNFLDYVEDSCQEN